MPIFSGFGPGGGRNPAAVDADARVLITADGFARAGKEVEMKLGRRPRACELRPAVERVLMLPPARQRRCVGRSSATSPGRTPVSDDPEPFDSLSLDASAPARS